MKKIISILIILTMMFGVMSSTVNAVSTDNADTYKIGSKVRGSITGDDDENMYEFDLKNPATITLDFFW